MIACKPARMAAASASWVRAAASRSHASASPQRWNQRYACGHATRSKSSAPTSHRASPSAQWNVSPSWRTRPGLLVEGGISTAGFEAYVARLLAPTLRPGQIVILDNLRQHQGARTRELIEARGAELWFLPSYSPDLNPIEEAFSKLKALLRTAAARTHEALAAAIWAGLQAITTDDAHGYCAHRGYPSLAQHA